LEDLVQDCPVHKRRRGFARRLDAVLQHGTTHATKRICHDRGRNQLIWVQDEEILGIVDDALALEREVADDMHVRLGVRWRVEPRASQVHRLDYFGRVGLDDKDLNRVSRRTRNDQLTYLLRTRIAVLVDVFAL